MTIEENIFKRALIDFAKLSAYGFRKTKNDWCYKTDFMNGDFKAVVTITSDGRISGMVYETATDDIFLPLRVEGMEGFATEVRNAYICILENIKKNCCHEDLFISSQANRLAQAVYQIYGDKPVFPWDDFSGGVFKNPANGKWYGIIMNVDIKKVDKNKTGAVDMLNIKLPPEEIENLHQESGFYPAYHMNKKNWITIVLNDSVTDEIILKLVDESHAFTLPKQKGVLSSLRYIK